MAALTEGSAAKGDCCCWPYCCCKHQLNMAGKEDDSSVSPGSSPRNGAVADDAADTNEDGGSSNAGGFIFRPSFLDGNDDNDLPDHLGPVKQLHSATGYNLSVATDGRVYGTREPFSEEAVLVLNSQDAGDVQIKGQVAQLYIAMDDRGRLYGEADSTSDNTIFLERYHNGWNCYLSKKHSEKGWYLGLKKSGKPKRGDKTKHGQKATEFVPRPAYPKDG